MEVVYSWVPAVFYYDDIIIRERGILSRATQFAHFHGISMFLQNLVLAGDKGTMVYKYDIFWSVLGGRM